MIKKLLFSDNTLWGLVNFRGAIIQHFLDRGYEIVLVAPEKENEQMRIDIPKGVKYIPVDMGRTSKSPINDLRYFFRILKVYRKEKPDYIFHYTIKPNIYGSMAAKLLGIHSSAMMAGMGYVFQNNGIACRIARALYKIGLKFTDHLFVLNESNREAVLQLGLCKSEKMILLDAGEGVDLDVFPFYDNQSSETTFLFIGRLLEDKGYYEFVDAAKKVKARHPETRFEILGAFDPQYPKGIPSQRFQKDIGEGTFEYLGFTNDMASIYQRKGLVITLPSFYGEGLNRVLMEACASGKPIITTNIAGCRETVDKGVNGYIIPTHDSDALAKAMNDYLSLSAEAKQKMSEASRRKAEKTFDIHRVLAVYDRVMQNA